MTRKDFIRVSGLFAGATLINFPVLASAKEFYTINELLGKETPKFYGQGYQLRKEVADAFEKMKSAALKEGIKIHSVSSFRSYQRQEQIWNNKYVRYTNRGMTPEAAISKIIEYSTMPGTSRHHWGTDLDIIDKAKPVPGDPLSARHFAKGQLYEDLHFWLNVNSEKFGFYLTYTNEPNRKGFKYEPWHFSYKEISQPMLDCYLELDHKKLLASNTLKGSKYITDEWMRKYVRENVKGINPDLLP